MIEKQELIELSIDNPDPQPQSPTASNRNPKILPLPDIPEPITGLCQQFISKSQLDARELSPYQLPCPGHPTRQPLACHFRNINYTPPNIRTPPTLAACLDHICQIYLPYYRSIFHEEAERKRLEFFLYDRVRAVRCQFFVQGVFEPGVQMRLVKLLGFLEVMIGQPVESTGIGYFLRDGIREELLADQQLKGYYYEALQYAILLATKQTLPSLLSTHFLSLPEPVPQTLHKTLSLKLKTLSNNYITFLSTLSSNSQPIFLRLLLWSQMKGMKEIIVERYRKAKMAERAAFLCRVLGYKRVEGWLDLSRKGDWERLEAGRDRFDLEVKLWIGEDQLLGALMEIEKNK